MKTLNAVSFYTLESRQCGLNPACFDTRVSTRTEIAVIS